MLSSPCEGDPGEAGDIAAWLQENVWTGFVPDPALPSDDHVVWRRTSPLVRDLNVSPSLAPRVIIVDYDHFVDVRTGVELTDGSCCGDTVEAAPPADIPGLNLYRRVGWPDGPAGAVGDALLHHLGLSASRLFRYDGAEWRLVAGSCAPPGWTVFTADADAWIAWADDTAVHWTPIGF
jgi:hypothetical protein